MSFLFKLAQHAAKTSAKKTKRAAVKAAGPLGSMLGGAAKGLASFATKKPVMMAGGALGLAGLNEQLGRVGMNPVGGTKGSPMWKPEMQQHMLDPTLSGGMGRSFMNAVSRPAQTFMAMTGMTADPKPEDYVNRVGIDLSKVKRDGAGKIIGNVPNGAIDLQYHDVVQQMMDRQKKMTSQTGIPFGGAAAGGGAAGGGTPTATRVPNTGPMTGEDYAKVWKYTDT